MFFARAQRAFVTCLLLALAGASAGAPSTGHAQRGGVRASGAAPSAHAAHAAHVPVGGTQPQDDPRRLVGRAATALPRAHASSLDAAMHRVFPRVSLRERGSREDTARVRRPDHVRGIGVRQRARLVRGGGLEIRTRIRAHAEDDEPALVTALRRFPDAVLVDGDGRGHVLQTPAFDLPDGRRAFARIDVARDGRTTGRLVDARTGRRMRGPAVLLSRDWRAHPAVVEREAKPVVYAVSDIHGGYDELVRLLERHGLVSTGTGTGASRAPRWAGGRATLVVVGDLVNKGPRSIDTLELVRRLQTEASDAGGELIVTYGNHETDFLADPMRNERYSHGIDEELRRTHTDPRLVAGPADPRGAWLRNLPFAARIGPVLFVHTGDTDGRSVREISREMRDAVDVHGYRHPSIVDRNGFMRSESPPLDDPGALRQNARAAGARHIVMGHEPSVLGTQDHIAATPDGSLTRIDVGMSPGVGFSQGALLRLSMDPSGVTADELRADGTVQRVWQRPAPATR